MMGDIFKVYTPPTKIILQISPRRGEIWGSFEGEADFFEKARKNPLHHQALSPVRAAKQRRTVIIISKTNLWGIV